MRFRTEVSNLDSKYKINHNSKILSLGSCFADQIGEKLFSRLFHIEVNPFGIAYNNYSLSKILKYCLDNRSVKINELIFNENSKLYFHYDFHSSISDSDNTKVVKSINQTIDKIHQYIKEVDVIIITMGTSYAYLKDDKIVANCHKMPAHYFTKTLIPVEKQVDELSDTIESLHKINSNVEILLTVSPIRHIKEGLANNTLSKSMLRLVCESLVNKFDQVNYFPSYEIMMDDLRDYRFYKSDLIHPNDMALTYIWNKFEVCFFNKTTVKINDYIEKLNKLKGHKVLRESNDLVLKHDQKISAFIDRLKTDYPMLITRLEKAR
jgi:hypothetical protein